MTGKAAKSSQNDEKTSKIMLVRHGSTGYDVIKGQGRPAQKNKEQEDLGFNLNQEGERQSRKLREKLEFFEPYRVVSSDLERAVETAKYLQDDFSTSEALREREFGDWTNEESSVIPTRMREDYGTLNPPRGESTDEVYRRTWEYLKSEVDPGENVVCVTHHGPIKAILYNGLEEDEYEPEVSNGSIIPVEMFFGEEEISYSLEHQFERMESHPS